MSHFQAFRGVFCYEFRMQIRRPGLWIFFALMMLYSIFITGEGLSQIAADTAKAVASYPLLYVVASNVSTGQLLLPLCVGCLLADRLVRDRQLKTSELLSSLGCPLHARLLGKYLGALAASTLPMLLVYAFFQGYILFYSHNLLVIPLFLFTFCLIALPGLLFVAAFSLACPIIMPLPVYQFLFTGYWLWGNLFLKQQILPTLSRSILTPSGVRIAGGFFGTDIDLLGHTSTFEAIASLGLLLCIAILVLLTLWGALRWQQARQ